LFSGKVFTFYSNRFDSATTSIALEENGIDHIVLVHTEEQSEQFHRNKTNRARITRITNKPRGLAYQRNVALDMMEAGEWAVFMCDDFKKVLSLPREFILSSTGKIPVDTSNQHVFRFRSGNEISLREMFEYFPTLIQMAERNGIYLIGFALHDNPMNLGNKFSFRALADGRFWLVRKTHRRFDENVQMIDDVAWTADNLLHHGNVLILNWIIPYFRRYTQGGFGSVLERLELRRRECAYLCKKYYPLIKSAEKPGWPTGTHLKIIGSQNNILKARENLLRIKRI
jgi:glycosyltransferase involved in cell wall biosynthesis